MAFYEAMTDLKHQRSGRAILFSCPGFSPLRRTTTHLSGPFGFASTIPGPPIALAHLVGPSAPGHVSVLLDTLDWL
jgi:hypothetical protein